FQSTGLMLAAFTFSRISFGPGVGIGMFRNFITSREPNVSIMTTSIIAMKYSSGLLQLGASLNVRSSFVLAAHESTQRNEHYCPVTAAQSMLLRAHLIMEQQSWQRSPPCLQWHPRSSAD